MRKQVLGWLSKNVPAKRVEHILGVEEMSIKLAQHHQIDTQKAALAGLMHDLAKYFKPQKLLDMAIEAGLTIDEVDRLNPHLLHADVSAIVAQQEFGVSDPEILQAIADHTLGRPQMSPLSCIVFLADTLEPGRGDTPELQKLRQLSHQNLHQAVWHTADYSLKHLLSQRCLIHPRTIQTRNWAMKMHNRQLTTNN